MEVRPGQGLLTLTMAGALLLTGCSGGESAGDRLQAVQAAYGLSLIHISEPTRH